MKANQEATGGVAIEAQANALAQVFSDMYDITWTCEKGHLFARGQVRNQSQCSICKTPLIKPIMNRRTEPTKKKEPFKLSGLEREALDRIT